MGNGQSRGMKHVQVVILTDHEPLVVSPLSLPLRLSLCVRVCVRVRHYTNPLRVTFDEYRQMSCDTTSIQNALLESFGFFSSFQAM
jgi:hypothetical protein